MTLRDYGKVFKVTVAIPQHPDQTTFIAAAVFVISESMIEKYVNLLKNHRSARHGYRYPVCMPPFPSNHFHAHRVNLAQIILKFRDEHIVFGLFDPNKMATIGDHVVMPRPQGCTSLYLLPAQGTLERVTPLCNVLKINWNFFSQVIAEVCNMLRAVIPVKMGTFNLWP
jgi:hypothetical protein